MIAHELRILDDTQESYEYIRRIYDLIHVDHKILMTDIAKQEELKEVVLQKPTFEAHFRKYMQDILAPSKTEDMLDVAQAFSLALHKTHINRLVNVQGFCTMEF